MVLQRMLQRRGTTAKWTAANPVLANGELGFDTLLRTLKIGDGTAAWADLPDFNGGGGGGGSVDLPFRTPEDFGAVGDGVADDGGAIQDAIDDLAAVGGGILMFTRGKQYGWTGDITQKTGVTVIGNGMSAFGTAAIGLIALDATARYRYGDLSGPGANPYPGTLSDLTINGDGVGGATNELLRIESVDASLSRLSVVNGVGHGVVFAAAQNTTLSDSDIDNFPNGAVVAFRNRDDGGLTNTQGSGSCRVKNCHITRGEQLILSDYVTTNTTNLTDPLSPGYAPMGPANHDCMVVDCILEQYQDVCHSIAWVRDGELQFQRVVFTGSSGFETVTADAIMLVENQQRAVVQGITKVTINNCYMGGGHVGVTDAIRSVSYGLANVVRWSGLAQVANVLYVLCDDRDPVGGGLGVVGGLARADLDLIGTITISRGLHGGSGGTYVSESRQPLRFRMDSTQGRPLQFRRDGENFNRGSIDRDMTIRWGNGVDASVVASIVAGATGIAFGGENYYQIAGFATGSRPLASTVGAHRAIYDTTLSKPIWSDGAVWRDATGAAA